MIGFFLYEKCRVFFGVIIILAKKKYASKWQTFILFGIDRWQCWQSFFVCTSKCNVLVLLIHPNLSTDFCVYQKSALKSWYWYFGDTTLLRITKYETLLASWSSWLAAPWNLYSGPSHVMGGSTHEGPAHLKMQLTQDRLYTVSAAARSSVWRQKIAKEFEQKDLDFGGCTVARLI